MSKTVLMALETNSTKFISLDTRSHSRTVSSYDHEFLYRDLLKLNSVVSRRNAS